MGGWKNTGESKACDRSVCDPENQQEPVPLGLEQEGNYGRGWHDVLDLSSWWPGQVRLRALACSQENTQQPGGKNKVWSGWGGRGRKERKRG